MPRQHRPLCARRSKASSASRHRSDLVPGRSSDLTSIRPTGTEASIGSRGRSPPDHQAAGIEVPRCLPRQWRLGPFAPQLLRHVIERATAPTSAGGADGRLRPMATLSRRYQGAEGDRGRLSTAAGERRCPRVTNAPAIPRRGRTGRRWSWFLGPPTRLTTHESR